MRSGETGWLLDEPDANHLESALDDAIATRDDTRAMGNRAAEIVSQMAVDTPSVVREVAGIYEQATVRRHD